MVGLKKTRASERAAPKRKARKPYHHGDLRRALTDGALVLVAEVGPQAFTLRELARRIGVSHTAPYRHFVDKRALLTTLAIEGGGVLHDRIARALADAGDDLRARFLAAGYAYVRFAIDEPSLFAVMFARDIDVDDPHLGRSRQRSLGLLYSFIAEAQSRGAIVEGSPEVLANPVWAMHHGLAMLAIAGRYKGQSDEAIRSAVDYAHGALLDGLLIRRSRDRQA